MSKCFGYGPASGPLKRDELFVFRDEMFGKFLDLGNLFRIFGPASFHMMHHGKRFCLPRSRVERFDFREFWEVFVKIPRESGYFQFMAFLGLEMAI